MTVQSETAIKILKSIQDAFQDVKGEGLWAKVYKEGGTPMDEFLSTMARIKYLELVTLKACSGEATGAKPALLRELTDDITKTLIFVSLEGKTIDSEDLSGFYGADFLDKLAFTNQDLRNGAQESTNQPSPVSVRSVSNIEADVKNSGISL